jgi:integrase
MSSTRRLKGHLHVRQLKSSKMRVYYAYWRDQTGAKYGVRLGPAHVRDAGRRTARGAIVWRAGDGPRPTPEHLTPQDAETRLEELLRESEARAEAATREQTERVLHQAAEGWLAERHAERGLKRSTVADYEDMFERLYRDLGADTRLHELADGRLAVYFADFKAERPLGKLSAAKALGEGRDVIEVEVERWTAKPPGSQSVEVATIKEAVRVAAQIGGTWKHRRRGCYRVVANGAERARRVSRATARRLEGEGWIVCRRVQTRWMLRSPAAAQTRNKYRDILAAVLDYAVYKGWLESNPLAAVKRASKRRARERILRRDDFYEPAEVDRLLAQAPGVVEEAIWLCGAHAGFRLPGEALGLRWGAVDFSAGVIRPYDNWVRNALDGTKTSDSAAIPMTPRLKRTLAVLKQRGYAAGDGDYVFINALREKPIAEQPIREAFALARQQAGLKPIRMYNLRHSFGTALARAGVDIRTIQALMRHERITTTEQYLAYSPQPDLAERLTRALDMSATASGS